MQRDGHLLTRHARTANTTRLVQGNEVQLFPRPVALGLVGVRGERGGGGTVGQYWQDKAGTPGP